MILSMRAAILALMLFLAGLPSFSRASLLEVASLTETELHTLSPELFAAAQFDCKVTGFRNQKIYLAGGSHAGCPMPNQGDKITIHFPNFGEARNWDDVCFGVKGSGVPGELVTASFKGGEFYALIPTQGTQKGDGVTKCYHSPLLSGDFPLDIIFQVGSGPAGVSSAFITPYLGRDLTSNPTPGDLPPPPLDPLLDDTSGGGGGGGGDLNPPLPNNPPATSGIPEPASISLVGFGLLSLFAVTTLSRRRVCRLIEV